MKRAWDLVTLGVRFWHGEAPQTGDELETKTGRRYLILNVKPKALECLVLPKDEPVTEGKVFRWQWAGRTRKNRLSRGKN